MVDAWSYHEMEERSLMHLWLFASPSTTIWNASSVGGRAAALSDVSALTNFVMLFPAVETW
jgi:hypothetical protein